MTQMRFSVEEKNPSVLRLIRNKMLQMPYAILSLQKGRDCNVSANRCKRSRSELNTLVQLFCSARDVIDV